MLRVGDIVRLINRETQLGTNNLDVDYEIIDFIPTNKKNVWDYIWVRSCRCQWDVVTTRPNNVIVVKPKHGKEQMNLFEVEYEDY